MLDLERSARRDVTFTFEAYTTSRATEALARDALVAAEENYRVQTARYQSGATDILNLIEAQFTLTQAQARRAITMPCLSGVYRLKKGSIPYWRLGTSWPMEYRCVLLEPDRFRPRSSRLRLNRMT